MLLGQVLVKVIALPLQILLSNLLGARIYGLYSLAVNVIQWLQHFSLLGMQNGVLRFIPIHLTEGDRKQLKGTTSGALLLSGGASLVLASVLWQAAPLLARVYFHAPEMAPVLKGLSVALPVTVLFWMSLAILRAFQAIPPMTWAMVVRSASQILILTAAAGLGFHVWGAIAAFGLSAAVGSALAFASILRILPDFYRNFSWRLRKLLRFSLPLCFAGVSYILMARLDLLLIGHFLAPESAGFYRAAVTLASLIPFPLTLLNTTFAPMISQLYHGGERKELAKLYQTVSRWAFLLGLPGCLALAGASKAVLTLFGSEFSQASTALMILAFGQLAAVTFGSVGFLLQMTGNQDWVLLNAGIASGVNLGLNLLFIPRWGISGAALATGLSYALNQGMNMFQVWRRLRLHPWGPGYGIVAVAGAAAAGVGLLLWAIHAPSLTVLIAMATLYGLMLLKMGLHDDDRIVLEAFRSRTERLLGKSGKP